MEKEPEAKDSAKVKYDFVEAENVKDVDEEKAKEKASVEQVDFSSPENIKGIAAQLKKIEEDKKNGTVESVEDLDNVEVSEGFVARFMSYVKTNLFEDHCQQISEKYNIPRKKVAKTAFSRILGTAGDVLLIGCTTFESLVYKFLNIAYIVLKKGVNMICSLAKAIFRMVTLDYTCVEEA